MQNAVMKSKLDYPRISAGTFSSILVEQMLIEEQKMAGKDAVSRLEFIRSKDVILSLRSKEIDIAILHEDSLKKTDPSEIDTEYLLDWTAVLLRPTSQPQFQLSTITWKENSFGDRLLVKFQKSHPSYFQESKEPPTVGDSFLSALEKIRRNLPYELVIPDIYLVDRDLKVLDALGGKDPDPVKGKLIAVFRTGERDQLSKYINKETWVRSTRVISFY